jgi:Putative adhesin
MGAMTMTDESRTQVFETPTPPKLRINIPSGRITVTADETAATRIELRAPHGDDAARDWIAAAEILQMGDEIVVRGPRMGFSLFNFGWSVEATVHAPPGSDATLGIGAGRIETIGRMGEVSVNTGAGGVHVAECAQARANTGAGNIEIAAVTGSLDAKTGAGGVRIGKVGADAHITTAAGNARIEGFGGVAKLKTAHGNIEVGEAGDRLDAFTASGNVHIRRADHGQVRARSVSGGVSVGVAAGVAALLDLSTVSGRVRSELEAGGAPAEGEPHVELILSTVSGNVSVARAEPRAA